MRLSYLSKRIVPFALFALTAIVPQGCQKDDSSTAKPEIVLQSSTLEVAPEGGVATMNYTINNQRQDATVSARCDAATWIHDFDCSTPGVISFTVDENPEVGQSRSATVTVSCDGAAEQVFEVLQGEGVEKAPFQIQIDEIGLDYVTATIVPQDNTMTWLALAYEQWVLDERFATIDEAIADLLNAYTFLASMYGVDLPTFMKAQILSTGTQTMTFDQLSVDTDHYVMAVGLSPDGIRLTEAVLMPFKTQSIEMEDVSFDISIDINGPYVTMQTVPSDKNIRYYTDVKLKSDWQNGPDIQGWIQDLIWRGSISGQSREEVIAGLSSYGDVTKEYYLNANTEYYAYAVAINEEGIVCSEEKTLLFTTGDVAMSENIFDIQINETGPDFVNFTVTPSVKNDVYTYAVTPVSDWEGMTDEEYLESYIAANSFFLTLAATSGDQTFQVGDLTSDKEYYLFIFGYEQDKVTTDLTKIKFKTNATSSASELTFEFQASDVTSNQVSVKVVPSAQDAMYYWDLIPASSATQEGAKAAVDARVQHWIDIGYKASRADVFASKGYRGTVEKTITAYDFGYVMIEPATEYKIFAVGIDDKTGEYVTDVYFSDSFTTLP